jgi:hypothetical protein
MALNAINNLTPRCARNWCLSILEAIVHESRLRREVQIVPARISSSTEVVNLFVAGVYIVESLQNDGLHVVLQYVGLNKMCFE